VGEVWLMDTGAAWEGTLSIMDIDTKEIVVSDKPVDMYPAGSGRF
jgi:serine/threonine protein phosphatase 1